MGLWNRLLRKQPPKPKTDALFRLPAASVEMESSLSIVTAGKAGVCFRTFETKSYEEMESDIRSVLAHDEFGMKYRIVKDSYGFTWVVLEDPDVDDLVAGIHMVSEILIDAGYERYILCAMFEYTKEKEKFYWIYSYGRGSFYPFAPVRDETRDFKLELSLRTLMAEALPVERRLEYWYPIWGVPF